MEQLIKVLWKSVFLFASLTILSRIIGKKLLSQLTYFDFVVAIIMGTVAGAFVVQEVKGFWVLLSPVVLTLCTILISYFGLKSRPLRKVLEGEPVVVIHNGKILERNMLKLRYNLDDLLMQLREKQIFDLADVEFAVFEPHGEFSVLKKSQNMTVTRKDMGLPSEYKGIASELIVDGNIVYQNLRQNNLDQVWLEGELANRGINDISDVFLASLMTDGTLYVDLKRDNLTYVQKVED